MMRQLLVVMLAVFCLANVSMAKEKMAKPANKQTTKQVEKTVKVEKVHKAKK